MLGQSLNCGNGHYICHILAGAAARKIVCLLRQSLEDGT